MSTTMVIHKAADEKLTLNIDNHNLDFIVGKQTRDIENKARVWKRFENDKGLYIPAFDDQKTFQGWAVLSPAPKTAADIESLGFNVFDSALSAAAVVIQQKIRSKGNGKILIDGALANLARQLLEGKITIEEMQIEAKKLLDSKVVQLPAQE